MQKLVLLVALASLLSLISLTDPLDRAYNESTLDHDLADILAHYGDSSAYNGIKTYLLVMAFTQEQFAGKTYRQILELHTLWDMQQKRKEAEGKARQERADREQEKRYESLRKVMPVTLTGREVAPFDTASCVTFFYTLKNNSRKGIRAVRGMVEINYGLYGLFLQLDLTFAQPLPARSSRQEKVTYTITSDPMKEKMEPGKLTWHPEMILFEDGQRVE